VVILIVASALLDFVVMYNLSNINICERQREIATLKVLGFYDNEVDNYITKENVLLTIIGIAIGLVFGVYLGNFMITTCEIDALMFVRHVNKISYVYSALITILFTIIVNIITHFNLKKINMIDSLKSVE
jgi:putative ABC transport system permease protein